VVNCVIITLVNAPMLVSLAGVQILTNALNVVQMLIEIVHQLLERAYESRIGAEVLNVIHT